MRVRADFYAFGVGVYVLWAAVSLFRTAAILSRRSLLALMRPLALAVAIGIKMAVVLTLWVRRARGNGRGIHFARAPSMLNCRGS